MRNDDRQDTFDRNLAEMFSKNHKSAGSDFQERLIEVVGREVRWQRRMRRQGRWFVRVAAAAVILIVAILTFQGGSPVDEGPIGTIADIQGLVLLTNGHGPEIVEGRREIHARQWVQTRSGTTARVVLTDQSQLTPQPRTIMQLDRLKHGHVVRIEEGAVAIQAHKQAPKKYLEVEAPGTSIKVLGTKLDVGVAERPSGARQTRIHLHSGSIEVTSGGVSRRLLPGMVAVAEEGREPVAQSSALEVNELRRLWNETQQRAQATDAQANMPMIIDYVNSTVWAMVPLNQFEAEPEGGFSLGLKYSAFGVKAYTQEGAQAKTTTAGRVLHIDLSQRPSGAETVTHVILRIPRATGLFHLADGAYELDVPGGDSRQVTLLQLCLPKSAKVEALSGQVIETSQRLNRSIVTLEADSHALQVYE